MREFRRNLLLLIECAALLGAPMALASPHRRTAASPCDLDINVNKPDSAVLSKETQLGQALAKEVERSSKVVNDPATTQYLNDLAQKLVRNSDVPFSIQIKIIDSDATNELILPGGFLYINVGLILNAETESELIGALAYGVAYSALRCGTEQVTNGQFTQVGSIAAMVFVPYGWAGYGIYEGMNLAIPLALMKEQRRLVLAADMLGVKYLYQTGYDPIESVRLLERISLQGGAAKNEATALSPFPPLAVRLGCMRKEIANVFPTLDEAVVSSSEFEKAKERLTSSRLIDSQSTPPPALRKPPTRRRE